MSLLDFAPVYSNACIKSFKKKKRKRKITKNQARINSLIAQKQPKNKPKTSKFLGAGGGI